MATAIFEASIDTQYIPSRTIILFTFFLLSFRSTVLRGGAVNTGGGSAPPRYAEPPLNDLYAPPTDMFSPPDG